MRIGWVGGLDRNEGHHERVAEAAGHQLEFHTGRLDGRGSTQLRALAERHVQHVRGTAVAHLLRSNGQPTLMWLRDADVAHAIRTERVNPRYLPQARLADGIEQFAGQTFEEFSQYDEMP